MVFPYINRELSWMEFNGRVLEEALKKDNPVMERLRFLAITASNLDEFFMVRVAGVKAQVNSKYAKADDSGLVPEALLQMLEAKTHEFMERQYSCFSRSIMPLLKKEGIEFLSLEQLDSKQKAFLADYFRTTLFPVLTPLAVDSSRPFPMLANKSLNIAVRLRDKEKSKDKSKEDNFAIVQVPSIMPRFIELKQSEGKRQFVFLEDIIELMLDELFELHDIKSVCTFRLTRNSDLEIDDEAEDFLEEIEKSIKKRRRGRPVRLELASRCDKSMKRFLTEMLKIKENEIYEISGPMDLTFLFKFAGLKGFEKFQFEPIVPVPAADFLDSSDIFETIREHDCLVHHPYESFDIVTDFILKAAEDENVLAIKQTLYRVSGHSPVIEALIKAAENGKQVTVLVELKARFDEENNLNWAKTLEKAGCHVIYGLQGLKTHCKIALIVRNEEDGIRRYLHLGTGNYNDSTARVYTDLGLFTCSSEFGLDASALFNVITGYSRPPEYNRFVVAPHGMRSFFVRMIKNETENAKKGLPSGITVKINSLVDSEIILLLYEASQAGVEIKLIVRGICCLVPGIKGVSDNITVISIVGQLLEHSRIFKFENAGNPKIYMGSADWMPRNLDRRIELVFPLLEDSIKMRVQEVLDITLNDNTNARIMQPDGTYHSANRRGKAKFSSQHELYAQAMKRSKDLREIEKSTPLIPIHSSDISK